MNSLTSGAADTAQRIKAIRNARVCVDCGHGINDQKLNICPRCDSQDISDRHSSPICIKSDEGLHLAFPFDGITMLPGTTMLLSGYKGSGKTTSLLKMAGGKQHRILSSEQQASAIAKTWYRIHTEDAERPNISHCYSWSDLLIDIEGLDPGEIVIVDSISQLATGHQTPGVVKAVIEGVRQASAYAFFITQFTKSGDPLGPSELGHLVDVTAFIPQDKKMGTRRLVIDKDRNGIAHGRYYKLGARGPEPEVFEYGYTIEGPAGDYRMHLYPLGGAVFGGIMDTLAGIGYNLEGTASCAISCNGYKLGYAQPSDIAERRRFAENHGLSWITPDDANEILAEHGGDDVPSTPAASNDPF